jgi:hypothetical protein
MDITLAFKLSGLVEVWISIRNINIGSEVKLSGVESSIPNEKLNESFILMPILMMFVPMMAISRGRKKKNERSLRERVGDFFAEHEGLKRKLIYIVSLTVILVVWDLISFYGGAGGVIEGVDTGDYTHRYEISMRVSIAVLIITCVLLLVPEMTREKFREYSVEKSVLLFGVAILLIISLLLWMNTSLISYTFDSDIVLLVNTAPSYWVSIIMTGIHMCWRGSDIIIFSNNSKDFRPIIEGRKVVAEKWKVRFDDFKLQIFEAIDFLGEDASITQIKKYFESQGYSKITREGKRLDKDYLTTLIREFYLVKELKDNNIEVFLLTPKGVELLKKYYDRLRENPQQQK